MNKIQINLSRLAVAALATVTLPFITGCNDLDNDDHYGDVTTRIDNAELKTVTQSTQEYIKSRADFSSMNKLFADNGVYDELSQKGQLATILVVANENYSEPVGAPEDVLYVTRSHISDVSVSPANLHDGDRLMMWHSKYTNVTIDDEGQEGHIIGHISFNNGVVQEVIQTTNGYIYVIDAMINTPTSLSDYINELGEDYSIFKDLVLSSGGKVFDRANSKPVGVNSEGNTVYDSVFITTNEHFDNVGFDMNSESLTATMLLPSDEVIRDAMADAKARLESWDMTRDDDVLKNWILDACFFNKRYTPEQLCNSDENDISSVFSKQWRTNAHSLETDGTIELSNGIVHKVKKIHIPNNVLMYRLKDWFYYYENCTAEQKENYFGMTNMAFFKTEVGAAAWSPLEGVWPQHEDRVLVVKPGDDGEEYAFRLDFTPIRNLTDDGGATVIKPYLIPPGAYRLAFGSKQNQNITITAKVLVEGQEVAASPSILLGSSTAYHYDRGTTLPNRYREGYDPSVVSSMGGSSKAGNYDTDGGPLIDEVVIPDLKGDNSAVPVVIRIEGVNWNQQTSFTLCHWCLRPTVNNY